MFCTFWLRNVLRATTACNLSPLIWPAGSAPAALASLLFDPPEPQTIGKTQFFATFLPFRASASSFFWLFLSYSSLLIFLFSLPLPCSSFHLSILSEVWLLNFLRWLTTAINYIIIMVISIIGCMNSWLKKQMHILIYYYDKDILQLMHHNITVMVSIISHYSYN